MKQHHIKRSFTLYALLLFLLAALPANVFAAAGAPPITIAFDHLTTGFELDGLHRDLPCESCHLNAVFRGTPRDCGSCHTTGSRFNATPKQATHIPSTNNCASCHNTISFRPFVHFEHRDVLGTCVACHNGVQAQGKGPTHPATSEQCEACHTFVSWNPPKDVDHSQIPLSVAGFCIICHNGVQASGKPANHIATNLECGDCHLTNTWKSARFDHTGITTNCVSCHNGVKTVGKQGGHMPTTNSCESCHTTGLGTATPSWVPSGFNHTQMTVTTCQTCHSGSVKTTTGFVSGQPTNHVPPIPSLVDCSVCHGNTPAKETWTVLAASIPQLHAGLSVNNCLMCHAGQTFAGVPAPYIPMSMSGVSPTKATPLSPPHIPVLAGTDCSACHGAAYQVGGFGPATAMSAAKHAFVSSTCNTCHDTGKSFYVGGGTPLQLRPADHATSSDTRMVSGDCSLCHNTTDWTSSELPAGHMPNPSKLTCVKCHASAPSDYKAGTLATLPSLHTGITSNCGLCHGSNAPLTWFNNYTPKDAVLTPSHIPYLSGTDCSSCHASNYVTGGFGPTSMSSAKHAFVPKACNTCHEAGLNFYMGASTPALQGRPADHLSSSDAQQRTGDCSGCHNTTDWNTTSMPPGHMPNPANQACSVCHTAITSAASSYATLASISVLHTGITSACAQCHGTTQLTFYNNYNPKAAVLTPSHIPYNTGTDCSVCHSRNYVAGGFGPTSMSAAKHAYVPTTCDTCHEAGLNFYMGASTPALQGRPADHISSTNAQMKTGDCSGCHQTTDWTTTALPAGHMPNPGNQACATCHIQAPSNYTVLASNAVLHTKITSGCAQCHGGAAQLTFYNNFTPKSAVLTPPHIPSFTGSDCSACHSTTNFATGGFGPMNMTAATHSTVGSTCNPCHETGKNFYMGAANPALQLRPADHNSGQMASPNDCNGCHTVANWNSNTLPSGHMPNPGNQACTVCHPKSPTNYTTLATNAVLHTGISSSQCAQCHGAFSALTWYNNFTPKDAVLSPAHIPYLAGTSCGSCHTTSTYTSFGPMNMSQATHSFVSATCITCHEAGLSFYMGSANPGLQGRPTDHNSGQMVKPNDCSLCHTTANWNSTALPAGHMPNPGNQACAVCHPKAPSDYTPATLASNTALHTGITSGCIKCHGAPNATPPVFYNGFTPKSAVLSPVHIPTSSTACESCHTASNFTSFSGTTMNSSKHTAMFAVIGSTCDACHDRVTPALNFYGVTNLQTRPKGHNSGRELTSDCSACHNTNGWGGGAATRKTTTAQTTVKPKIGIVVNPSRSGTGVPGGGVARLVRGALAGEVVDIPGRGNTASLPGRTPATTVQPSHFGVTSNCVSCHNGTLATGKSATHITTNDACQNCHTTIAWLPARFDHRGVTGSCISCHNGAASTGKPARHIQTTQDCGACHNTIEWKSVRFSHMGTLGTCLSCHNGVTATGKNVQHVVTTQDCGSCHNTMSWTVVTPTKNLQPLLRGRRGATGERDGPQR